MLSFSRFVAFATSTKIEMAVTINIIVVFTSPSRPSASATSPTQLHALSRQYSNTASPSANKYLFSLLEAYGKDSPTLEVREQSRLVNRRGIVNTEKNQTWRDCLWKLKFTEPDTDSGTNGLWIHYWCPFEFLANAAQIEHVQVGANVCTMIRTTKEVLGFNIISLFDKPNRTHWQFYHERLLFN